MKLPWFYGLIGKITCWSYFCYMSMGVREWLRWWVAFLGGLLLCQERYWALQEYAHFGLYNRQITKLSEWPMLEWTLSTTSTALLSTMVESVFSEACRLKKYFSNFLDFCLLLFYVQNLKYFQKKIELIFCRLKL